MRRTTALLPACLILLVACQRPDVEAFQNNPKPVVVVCTVTPQATGSKDFAATMEAALRVRLATRVMVVPEGVAAPPDAVRLEIDMQRLGIVEHKGSNGAAVGVTVGASVGVLSGALGNRDWLFDGLFWGLWAGGNASAQADRFGWLGYYPDRLESQVRLVQAGNPEPLAVESINTEDILNALQPLRGNEGSDETRVEEAEAQAYARVLVARLTETFKWQRGPARYFGAPAAAPEPMPPAAQPLNQQDPPLPAPDKDQPAPEPGKDQPAPVPPTPAPSTPAN